MTKKLMILSCLLLATLVMALVATSGERAPTAIPDSGQAAVGRTESGAKGPCYYLGYAGAEYYYWQAPHPTYTDQPYAQRFTVTEPETLVEVDVWIYDDGMFGNDDVYITIYADDGAGLPGAQLAQVTLPAGTYSAYPTWTTADFSGYNLIVNGDFHVGFSSSGPQGIDWENCMSDDGLSGTGRSSSYWEGAWHTMVAGGWPDVNFHFWPYLCKMQDCDWQPGMPFKMHWPQMPDTVGWDVDATYPVVLADDWRCTEDGPVEDIHFWGSWRDDIVGQIQWFILSIHRDIPADQSPTGYSMPGEQLWWREVFDFTMTGYDPPTMEGWYDPVTDDIRYDNHVSYFQYNVCFEDDADWFWQEQDSIYWLNISAVIVDTITTHWGWKSTYDPFNDDAVWAFDGDWNWIEMYEPPPPPVGNHFGIYLDEFSEIAWWEATDYYGNGFYFYPWYDWYNVWFYDHPFTYDRFKQIHIEFPVQPTGPSSYVEVALNWSTDLWAIDSPMVGHPPLPGVNEDLYIGRHTVIAGSDLTDYVIYDYTIPDYNPEWVSFDITGYNTVVEWGTIEHACIPKAGQEPSLNLAFVITTGEAPPPEGACCYDPTGLAGDETTCIIATEDYCVNTLGGVYMGDGTQCYGVQACCFADGSCIDADSLCCADVLGGSPQGYGTSCGAYQACCINDGCQMMDSLCCEDLGGIPQGTGTQCSAAEACCLPGGACTMIDPLCCDELGGVAQGPGTQCTVLKPCCLPGGGCQMLDPICCDDEGGWPSPIGAATCLGDTNSNQINDACEGGWSPGDPHKMHFPQLPDPDGWDVKAIDPVGILCDDWTCSATGPVLDLHFWGSWKGGLEGQIVGFEFIMYSNIPDYESPTGYSVPNMPLWTYYTEEFGIVPVESQTTQGWYDPATGDSIFDDHQSFYQYNVYIPEALAFEQDRDSVYWLCIKAHRSGSGEPLPYWGWKSSENHHLDDAVYADWPWVPEPLPPEMWTELYEPGATGGELIVNQFEAIVDDIGQLWGSGEDAYGQGWYYYQYSGWWNIWFYDHPFTYERYKTIHIEIDLYDPGPLPSYFVLAVNWSTDLWSLGRQDSMPPLPGVDEELFIGRHTLFEGEFNDGHYSFDYEIPGYNPEWVSVDVRGHDFGISHGWIEHRCVGPQSLDLSFVITGAEVCDCIPGDADGDGNHLILDVTYIINYLYKNGPPPIPYALCSGDADCDCSVLILDVTYLINYLYKNGPPPCTCDRWLINCGSPLRN